MSMSRSYVEQREHAVRTSSIIPALSSIGTKGRLVEDPDEELFLLYTLSTPDPGRRGLGQIDSHNDRLRISVDLQDHTKSAEVSLTSDEDTRPTSRSAKRSHRVERRAKNALGHDAAARPAFMGEKERSVTVCVDQNSTSLRSTAGDTGSVVWRSSISLGTKLLRDISTSVNVKYEHGRAEYALLDPDTFQSCCILELGAGTGILPCMVLSHPANTSSACTWMATDQENILPLLRKNIQRAFPHRSQIQATCLDWMEASNVYNRGTPSAKRAYLSQFAQEAQQFPDLIIATDCIFNPHLFPAFLDTLHLFSRPPSDGHAEKGTLALIVCELREPEAVRDFLERWLAIGKYNERWCVTTIEDHAILGQDLTKGNVVWAGWRQE